METKALKALIIYSAVAVVLGLSLTLLPLVTLALVKPETHEKATFSAKVHLDELKGSYEEASEDSLFDFEVLSISFLIALLAYLVIKRRHPHRTYRKMGDYLYYF